MFPLHDDNPTQDTSIVVYALIVINVLIFGYQVSLPNFQLVEWLGNWALIPRELIANPNKEAIALLSSQFLHADIFHLVGNMWFLYLFGNNIEDQLGHWKFLFFYLICGMIAAGIQVLTAPNSLVPMVGASGAISGIMGAYIVRFPRARILSLVFFGFFITAIPIPAFIFLGLWIAGQTIYAAMANPNLPGVAYLAHVSGFVAGAIAIYLFSKFAKK
ncbi:rhomboid family intramembrane serine protease [Pseudanabaena sp. FACHB-1998]|uniref:rhomboid family intramembrane serine protease n=1 Tax=Pseudanabaena sp. FACHB-1998 TaxID=2692858 RepID=UPI00167FF26F|nr:rhomboid family intramembrane serine protease [Pseudanabaena sp. FACHB-1998]MBD2176512.1 rhomboid family intramembrane serine protease [Pseudanabaena sp. FACHB-1998]